jgi:hypothetical protein
MSYTTFTAEQLAQVARADMQQSELLRYWLPTARDRHCDHSNLSRVLATGRGFYRACRDRCARLEYSLDEGSTQRRACAGEHRPAPGCAI